MAKLNIGKFLPVSEIEGPGKRFVIWFQGCNINCRGCSNVDLLAMENKLVIEVKELLKIILKSKEKNNIVGVTLLGGEPFLQPDGLKELIFSLVSNELDIVCFTGYIYEKLKTEYNAILNKIDILIDGPFILKQLDHNRRLIGSKNQRVLKLTNKYINNDYFEVPYSEVDIQLYKDRVELNGDGVVFKDFELLRKNLKK